MLKIVIPAIKEIWDEVNEEFIASEEQTLELEHSLVSLSKWESNWQKPFLTRDEKTQDEQIDYIKCMTINPVDDPSIYNLLNNNNLEEITKYIESPMTATRVPKSKNGKGGNMIVTAELIYYWMIALNIPFECQHWHLNKLLTLIEVCNFENQPKKKMSKREILSRNAALNAARRQQFKS